MTVPQEGHPPSRVFSASARETLDAQVTERQFAEFIEDLLRLGGWHWFHPVEARRAATILDYVCWRNRVIWIELKREGGRLSRDRWVTDGRGRRHFIRGQETVIAELVAAGQTVYVWRPRDADEAARVLVGTDASTSRAAIALIGNSSAPGTSRQ